MPMGGHRRMATATPLRVTTAVAAEYLSRRQSAHLLRDVRKFRTKPRAAAPTNGTGASVATSALLVPMRGLLRSPSRRSALSLIKPTAAQRRNSPAPPRNRAAHAP